MLKRILKILSFTAFFCLALCGTALAALAYPQPFFPYSAMQGRLWLYSDQPFNPERARDLLNEVERRLARSSLNDAYVHRIFITNSEWRRRLLFLWNMHASGLNYYPVTRNVFIRWADIDHDRVMTSAGSPKPAPRTLSYYAAHEIGHTLIKERLAPLQQFHLPRWINEGLADDIGFADDADIKGLALRLQSGDPELDPLRSGHYDLNRLLVVFVLKHKGWSAAELVASFMMQADAEALLMTEIAPGKP